MDKSLLQPLIVANWKMNHSIIQTADFIRLLQTKKLPQDRTIVICPSFISLFAFKNSGLMYGAQNMHWEEQGAYTGEISATMLKEVGCSYVIIGHSERRQYFGETDETVAKKVTTALQYDLMPIVCVRSIEEVTPALIGKNIVIAYEPVWAIGTGKAATPEQAQEVHAQIRAKVGDEVRILYGGSVSSENAASLMAQADVNGLLVGGASLDVEQLVQIVKY